MKQETLTPPDGAAVVLRTWAPDEPVLGSVVIGGAMGVRQDFYAPFAQWLAGDGESTENLLDRIEIEIGARPSYTGQTTGRVRLYLNKRSPRSGRATYLSGEVDVYDRVNFGLGLMFRPR